MEIPAIGFYGEQEQIDLPPGFRFHPTDEELISHYLSSKALDVNFSAIAIGVADFNKCEPWDLPKVAKMGENEWYFFSLRDRKYPTGQRTNRATGAGYWKATGKDKEIYKAKSLVGMKKTLVFYQGRAPRGEKSNWIMHEFRLFPPQNLSSSSNNEWVIFRVFHKSSGEKKSPFSVLNVTSNFTTGSSSNVPCFSTPNSDQNPVLDPYKTTPINPNHYYYPGNETGYPVYQSQTDPFNPHSQYPFDQSLYGGGRKEVKHGIDVSLSQDTAGFSSELNPEISSAVSSYDMAGGAAFVGQAGPSTSMGPFDIDSIWDF